MNLMSDLDPKRTIRLDYAKPTELNRRRSSPLATELVLGSLGLGLMILSVSVLEVPQVFVMGALLICTAAGLWIADTAEK